MILGNPKPYNGKGNYVFVSYSHKDKDIVYKDLFKLEEFGVRFWYDDDLPYGEK